MTIDELFALYCRKKLRTAAPNTIRLYRASLTEFERSLGRKAEVEDLTDDNLETLMWNRIQAGLATPTVNKDHNQITAIWRFANRNRLVATWPNVPMLPTPEIIPLGWTQDELTKLFTTVEQMKGSISGAPARLWWRTLINIILDTGERIGAIRDLTLAQLHGEYILVPAQFRKGKKRDKLYKLDKATICDIQHLTAVHGCDLILPWDRSRTYIYKRYDKILKNADLSHDRRSKFHRFRRTVASAVANMGGNPTAALDHSSPKTTEKYLDPRIVDATPTVNYVRAWRDKLTIKDSA